MQWTAQTTDLNLAPLSLPPTVLQQCVLLIVLISMMLSETHATQAKISMRCANRPSEEKLLCIIPERLH